MSAASIVRSVADEIGDHPTQIGLQISCALPYHLNCLASLYRWCLMSPCYATPRIGLAMLDSERLGRWHQTFA